MASKADEFLAAREAARGFIVVVGEQSELEDEVIQLADDNDLEIPLTFFADGPEGDTAKTYKLNPDVKFTVLVYDNKQVAANFGLDELTNEAIDEIMAAWDGVTPQ